MVVADSRAPRDGRFIEVIGHYNPLTNPPTIKIETDKAAAWIKKGAQPSNTVKHAPRARASPRADGARGQTRPYDRVSRDAMADGSPHCGG